MNIDIITHSKPLYFSTLYKLCACTSASCPLPYTLQLPSYSVLTLYSPSACPFLLPAPPFSPVFFSPSAIPGQQWQRQSGLWKDQAGKGGVSYTRRPLGKRRPSHIPLMTACCIVHPDLHTFLWGLKKNRKWHCIWGLMEMFRETLLSWNCWSCFSVTWYNMLRKYCQPGTDSHEPNYYRSQLSLWFRVCLTRSEGK